MHLSDILHKIQCTERKITRLINRGQGKSRDVQRLRELVEELHALKAQHESREVAVTGPIPGEESGGA